MYIMRFDLRAPAGDHTEILHAALDMAAWGEGNGALAVVLSEHHGSPDGFLPSPLVAASAMAARTESLPIMLAALILPLYDPVRLAEDMIVLDHVSRGRVSHVLALGYRPEELELFGLTMGDRARVVEEKLEVLLAALRGEQRVDRPERRGAVTPPPFTPGGPRLSYGGSSVAAARRAARFGLDLFAQTDTPALAEAYQQECARLGREPGSMTLPDPTSPFAVFVADDLDAAWDELGPHLLHDATTYAAWNEGDRSTASLSRSGTVEDLRVERGAHRILTVDEAVEHVRRTGYLALHPLCGGIPPEVAWPYLRRVADEVLPRV
jgi:alkanesulfonate monooxygenase SsuD/methylene tetrahydromethanopterin reductase-like flavin-dependent oxidoreductase (luciferase family)